MCGVIGCVYSLDQHAESGVGEAAKPKGQGATSPRSAARLFIFYVVGCLCGGLIPGQAIFTKLFADAGLFSDLCADVASPCEAQYNTMAQVMVALAGFISAALLPAGVLFDLVGGRVASAAGCVILVCGILALCALLTFGGGQYEATIFTLAILLCDLGSCTPLPSPHTACHA